MKKLMLTIAAMFVFSIAAAQIDPNQPQQTQPDPAKAVNPDTKNTTDKQVEVPIDPKTLEEQKSQNHEPFKDELKTKDHVKSTPDPSIVKDKKKDEKQRATKFKKKKRNMQK